LKDIKIFRILEEGLIKGKKIVSKCAKNCFIWLVKMLRLSDYEI